MVESSDVLRAIWQVAVPVIVILIAQFGALVVYLSKQSQIIKFHSEQHADHRKRFERHSDRLEKHGVDIAVIKSRTSLDAR